MREVPGRVGYFCVECGAGLSVSDSEFHAMAGREERRGHVADLERHEPPGKDPL